MIRELLRVEAIVRTLLSPQKQRADTPQIVGCPLAIWRCV